MCYWKLVVNATQLAYVNLHHESQYIAIPGTKPSTWGQNQVPGSAHEQKVDVEADHTYKMQKTFTQKSTVGTQADCMASLVGRAHA